MLALKKKREAEKAAAAAAEAAAAVAAEEDTATVAVTDGNGPTTTTTPTVMVAPKISLLGIGGIKKKDVTSAANNNNGSGTNNKKRTPGEIRIQKDIAELDGGKVAKISFPNTNDFTAFHVQVTPDSGYWKNATYKFVFTIPSHYPHSPPKVECTTKIYHPNIDLEGKVCLNILREDWRPVLDINSVIYGLIYLFYEPNPLDPLNHQAAELFRQDITQFERLVNRTLKGGYLEGTTFERLI